ncbi:MAG: ABC transporter substrate-binding protein [Lachnospiraceae bacterium]|nr:ABC transporter substrate-binding protein [Lachnospiraceae bacterium]
MRKQWIAMILILCMMVNLCGCQKKKEKKKEKELTQVTMMLDWSPNTNHTGLYVAQAKGYFDDVGLEVEIVLSPDDTATDMVSVGTAEFGIDSQDNLAEGFVGDDPLSVTAVAAIIQHNTSGLISTLDKGIRTVKDLEDHTFATKDVLMEQTIIHKAMEKNGGDFGRVKLISSYVDDIVTALHTDIECVWSYYGWDGVRCEQEGMLINFVPLREMDETFDFYSPVIIANNDFLTESPDTAEAFLKAVKKGYEFAVKKPEDAAAILCAAAPNLNRRIALRSQQYLSEQYINDAAQFGVFDADRWNLFFKWVNENKLVDGVIPENTGFTNEYIVE